MGLGPDPCGALVTLLAGSRRYWHNGKRDSLLAEVRFATDLVHAVERPQPSGAGSPCSPALVNSRASPVVGADGLAMAGCEW